MENKAGLQQMLLDERIRGRSYLEMEAKHGIPAIECRQIVLEALAEHETKDPVEWRLILSARLEKISDNLWDGLENGSFKHGETIIKAIERLADMLDLNESARVQEVIVIQDQQVEKILMVVERQNRALQTMLETLNLDDSTRAQLEAEWPEWTAQALTDAVEEVVYAEILED